ncbi:MAG: F0F1 ATP synthase subunit alpha, partial [Gammaproteobacteria bacterium]|nr:F0F1 ATP synthase subunit alpha [Gammaproteobacteria bacterium]
MLGWAQRAAERVRRMPVTPSLEHVGIVERIGDGVATVVGLPATRLDEVLRFEDGSVGVALGVSEVGVDCVMLESTAGLASGSRVYGTGEVLRAPVGEDLLGRVVDPTGLPLDDGPPIVATRFDPVERPAPGIVDRDLVSEPLMTGITVVDAMIPLGRGQRELIIGDRKTGKTAIAIDTVIAQRDNDVICVYAVVGQKASALGRLLEAVREHGNPNNCIFVVGRADAPPGAQWLVPYSACTMAEYFRDRGRDALLVIDDLTQHAIIYRQLALLLRRPPGREAYTGDVFYLHSRLLERAAKLSDERGAGSLTALPVIET